MQRIAFANAFQPLSGSTDLSAPPTVLLLTATISVGDTCFVQRRQARLRLDDYRHALELWLRAPLAIPIVFCENSGSDLSELRELCRHYNPRGQQVEFLSFAGQDFPGERGKGYGELQIISHVLHNSRMIRGEERVLKVTGRLFVRNIAKILRDVSSNPVPDVFCDWSRNLTWADSRVFCALVPFLRSHLLPLQELVNDSQGVCLEHALSRAVHQAIANGLHWALIPRCPDVVGISGTSGLKYPSSPFCLAKRSLMRSMKAVLLER